MLWELDMVKTPLSPPSEQNIDIQLTAITLKQWIFKRRSQTATGQGTYIVGDFGRVLTETRRDQRENFYLMQIVSLAVQPGCAVKVSVFLDVKERTNVILPLTASFSSARWINHIFLQKRLWISKKFNIYHRNSMKLRLYS